MMDKTPQNILYSKELSVLTASDWKGWCVHMICTRGSVHVRFDGRDMSMKAGDLLVSSLPELITVAEAGPEGCEVEMIIGPNNFLQNQLPHNNFGVAGSISLYKNPIMPLLPDEEANVLRDFRNIAERLPDKEHPFFYEMIGSLCQTMMYDIFAPHLRRDMAGLGSLQQLSILDRLMKLLETGITRRHREVAYYADRLNVSSKYLTTLVRRQTGQTVTSIINRYAVPILIDYLRNSNLSMAQICDEMDFKNVSYFSQYVRKHLGMTPSAFRSSAKRKND